MAKKMSLHSNVKEREYNHYRYFHAHVKTKIDGRKIESQKYFPFDDSDRDKALTLANAKAVHLCHRHDQLRQARENRVGLAQLFFQLDGTLKYLKVNKRIRFDRADYIELVGQKLIDDYQYKIARTLPKRDPDFIVFDMKFTEVFEWLCDCLSLNPTNQHVQLLKAVARETLLEQYKRFTK